MSDDSSVHDSRSSTRDGSLPAWAGGGDQKGVQRGAIFRPRGTVLQGGVDLESMVALKTQSGQGVDDEGCWGARFEGPS